MESATEPDRDKSAGLEDSAPCRLFDSFDEGQFPA